MFQNIRTTDNCWNLSFKSILLDLTKHKPYFSWEIPVWFVFGCHLLLLFWHNFVLTFCLFLSNLVEQYILYFLFFRGHWQNNNWWSCHGAAVTSQPCTHAQAWLCLGSTTAALLPPLSSFFPGFLGSSNTSFHVAHPCLTSTLDSRGTTSSFVSFSGFYS